MTIVAPAHITPEQVRRTTPSRRLPLLSAAITAACVGMGFVVALVTLPPVETPVSAIEQYMAAEKRGDLPRAWELLSEEGQEGWASYDTFVQRQNYWATEFEDLVDQTTEVIGFRGVREPSPGLLVSMVSTRTEQDRSVSRSVWIIKVVQEDGHFRVCGSLECMYG